MDIKAAKYILVQSNISLCLKKYEVGTSLTLIWMQTRTVHWAKCSKPCVLLHGTGYLMDIQFIEARTGSCLTMLKTGPKSWVVTNLNGQMEARTARAEPMPPI
jgi:hypothetical protein